ncbi:hypothetical protein AAFP30_21680 [Gordonia sp. CPCC 205515]|uniref:hypothetical protein n=1 Tax=Gordonia sp. CPCC 205515 TaxID=3140791 RepID=UPI003AF33F94
MSTAAAVAVAVTFVWLGMVLAISFLEAPLKFRAPGVTLPIGLGIGRLVFRALNAAETLWAAIIVVAVVAGSWSGAMIRVVAAIAVVALVVQLVAIRPALTRRSNAVLAGHDGPRSHVHVVYVGLEVVKVIALVCLGITLLVTA